MGIPFVPSLHPRDLFGKFKNKKGGPRKAKATNRINPIKQAQKVATKALENEGKKWSIPAKKVYYGSVRTRSGRTIPKTTPSKRRKR